MQKSGKLYFARAELRSERMVVDGHILILMENDDNTIEKLIGVLTTDLLLVDFSKVRAEDLLLHLNYHEFKYYIDSEFVRINHIKTELKSNIHLFNFTTPGRYILKDKMNRQYRLSIGEIITDIIEIRKLQEFYHDIIYRYMY